MALVGVAPEELSMLASVLLKRLGYVVSAATKPLVIAAMILADGRDHSRSDSDCSQGDFSLRR
eukprot:4905591-Amphidinium_carterae.1